MGIRKADAGYFPFKDVYEVAKVLKTHGIGDLESLDGTLREYVVARTSVDQLSSKLDACSTAAKALIEEKTQASKIMQSLTQRLNDAEVDGQYWKTQAQRMGSWEEYVVGIRKLLVFAIWMLVVLCAGLIAVGSMCYRVIEASNKSIAATDQVFMEKMQRDMTKEIQDARAAAPSPASIPATAAIELPRPTSRPLPNGFTTIAVKPLVSCWLRIQEYGHTLYEGTSEAGKVHTFDGLSFGSVSVGKVSVRAGCPGEVEYYMDGKRLYPKNQDPLPKNVELVSIP